MNVIFVAVVDRLRLSKTAGGFLRFLTSVDPAARAGSGSQIGEGVSSPRRDNKRERVKNRFEEPSEGVSFPKMLVTKLIGFEIFRFRVELGILVGRAG